MVPIRGGILASLCRQLVGRRYAFGCEFLSTPTPSLCHAVPRGLALRIARQLGHLLAIGGVLQKFVRWVHRTISFGPLRQPGDRSKSSMRLIPHRDARQADRRRARRRRADAGARSDARVRARASAAPSALSIRARRVDPADPVEMTTRNIQRAGTEE